MVLAKAADVLYFTLVKLAQNRASLNDVLLELGRRETKHLKTF